MVTDSTYLLFREWYLRTYPQGKIPQNHTVYASTKAVYDFFMEDMKGKGYRVKDREATSFGNAYHYLKLWEKQGLIQTHPGMRGVESLISLEV